MSSQIRESIKTAAAVLIFFGLILGLNIGASSSIIRKAAWADRGKKEAVQKKSTQPWFLSPKR